ncbi:MAG: YbfB/YjiJ family MFS transporter [Actinomycetes bacterium]
MVTESERRKAPPAWLPPLPVHYGWVIVLVGVLLTLSSLGITRFAFGMILPSMGAGLRLSYAQMGVLSTGNFLAYLVGAVASAGLARRLGARVAIVASQAVIMLSLVAVAVSNGFWVAAVAFTVTGLGSGVGNVVMVGLVSHWFLRSVRGRAAGLVVTGSGYAIMISGVLIPFVNTRYGRDGWRVNWLVLASLVAVIGVLALLLLRNYPRDVGAEPVGHAVKDAVAHQPVPVGEQRRTTLRLGILYSLFGFSYVIYVTFIVTTLVDDRGFGESAAGWFWFAVGFLSIFSGPIFGAVSDHAGRKIGLAAVFAMHTLSFLLVGLDLPRPYLYLSVVFFGLAAWSIPGIMGATVGDYMSPHQAVRSLGVLTVFFGAGQALGPVVAGVLADRSGNFNSSYLLASALAALGAVGALTMRQPGSRRSAGTRA